MSDYLIWFALLIAAYILITCSSFLAGWFAGRNRERKIWCSRLHKIIAQTKVEELRPHLPVVKAGELKDA